MRKTKFKKLAFLFILSPLTLSGIASCGSTTPEPIEQKSSVIKVKEGITNGTVTTSLTGTTKVNTEVKIIAIPDEGYEVGVYSLNGEIIVGDTFNTVEGVNEVSATFLPVESDVEYGSVQVIEDNVVNGKVVAKLKDGTTIDLNNRRQEVGTEIFLTFEGVNECYEIKEVKLNDTTLEVKDGACQFKVVKGKNFISATFGLIHPGQGLIKLENEVSNAKVEITNLNEYVAVDSDITIKVTPEANYTVKTVTANGEVLKLDETLGTYTFKAKEGLNTVSVLVTSVAEGIEIVIPEDLVKKEGLSTDQYYVEVGKTFKLETIFTPEGSFDNLLWELVYDSDAEYVEVSKDGTIKILKESRSRITVKVSLKSNPDISDRIDLLPVSPAEFGVRKLASDFKRDKQEEITRAKKSNVVIENKKREETKASKTTYDFEAYKEGHSVTKVTDDKGLSSFFYRTISNSTFYSIYRDASGDKAVEEATKVTATNKEELETRVKVFGGVEFIESLNNVTYDGALGLVYETLFGEYSIYDTTDETSKKQIFDGTVVTYSDEGYKLTTDYKYYRFGDWVNCKITLDINYNFLYDRIDTISYERKDYFIESEDASVAETTPFELEKISATLTYGEKEADSANLFDLDSYLLKDFAPIVYTNRSDIETSTLKPNAEGKLELKVDETYYIDINKYVPETALDEFNELKVETNNKDVIRYISPTSYNAKYYIEPASEGEATLTFTVGSIVKTLDVVVSYNAIESVTFDTTEDTSFINNKVQLKASVTPDKGVASTDVTFQIKEGTNTCDATIIEEASSYSTKYYVTAPKAGSVVVVATSVADPTKQVEKTFTFKETPNLLPTLSNKTFTAAWSEFDLSTYSYNDYNYEIKFGEDPTTCTIKFTITSDYSSSKSEYSATVAQNGTQLAFSEFKDLGTSALEASKLPTLNLVISSQETLEKLTLSYDGSTKDLIEFVEVLPSLNARTFRTSEGDLSLSFKEADGKMKCSIIYEYSYYEVVTYEFTSDVEQVGNKIKLVNIVAVTTGADSSVLPTTQFDYVAKDGKITSLSYVDYYNYTVELTEVL